MNVLLSYTSPKISHNFQGIHDYIVNIWKNCIYSMIRTWFVQIWHQKVNVCDMLSNKIIGQIFII